MNEEFLAALATLAKFAPTIGGQQANDDGLGFCNPPAMGTAIYINDENGSFYTVDLSKPKGQQKVFVPQKAIKGYIKGLRTGIREYKGKPSLKVRVDILADKLYMLEKAANTNFAGGLLLSLLAAKDSLSEPVIIEISEPAEKQEKTCFCNLYTAEGRVRVEDKSVYRKEDEKYIEELIAEINKGLE